MKRSKYSIEIELNSEATGYEDRAGFLSYGTICAEGDTLEELLDDASVDLVDQDGGNPKFSPVPADEAWMQELIEKEFKEKYPDDTPDKYVFGRLKNTGDLE
jgi:hypothetical protein